MTYDKSSHTVFHHHYHIVRIIKYEFKAMWAALHERVREIVLEDCRVLGATIITGVLSNDRSAPVRFNPTRLVCEQFRATREKMLIARDPAGVRETRKR